MVVFQRALKRRQRKRTLPSGRTARGRRGNARGKKGKSQMATWGQGRGKAFGIREMIWEETAKGEGSSNIEEAWNVGGKGGGKTMGKTSTEEGKAGGRFLRGVMALGEGPRGEVTSIQATDKIGVGTMSRGTKEGGGIPSEGTNKSGLVQGKKPGDFQKSLLRSEQ